MIRGKLRPPFRFPAAYASQLVFVLLFFFCVRMCQSEEFAFFPPETPSADPPVLLSKPPLPRHSLVRLTLIFFFPTTVMVSSCRIFPTSPCSESLRPGHFGKEWTPLRSPRRSPFSLRSSTSRGSTRFLPRLARQCGMS